MALIQWKQINPVISGSADLTGSLNLSGSQSISGDLTVGGILTAREYHSEMISASVLFESGSSLFGNSFDDTHEFTGSVNITGSLSINNQDINVIIGSSSLFQRTGSFWATTNDVEVTGSLRLELDGVEKFFSIDINGVSQVKVNQEGVLQLAAREIAPSAVEGGLFYSSSNEFYLGFL